MTVNEKTLVACELATLASDAFAWKVKYGNKTLAEVLSANGMDCDDLCSMGIATDYAVELSAKTSPRMLARSVVKTTVEKKHTETPAVVTVKKAVIHKADGRKIVRIKRGDHFVTSRKESDLFEAKKKPQPKTRFVKSKKTLISKAWKKTIVSSNGSKLELHYLGDDLVRVINKGQVSF